MSTANNPGVRLVRSGRLLGLFLGAFAVFLIAVASSRAGAAAVEKGGADAAERGRGDAKKAGGKKPGAKGGETGKAGDGAKGDKDVKDARDEPAAEAPDGGKGEAGKANEGDDKSGEKDKAASGDAAEKAPLTEAEKIEALMAALEGLEGAKFIRNDVEHEPKAVTTHFRQKMQWREGRGEKIATARDFIRLVGSKSFESGKVYRIRFKDGKSVTAEKFFNEKLRELNAKNKAGAKGPKGKGGAPGGGKD